MPVQTRTIRTLNTDKYSTSRDPKHVQNLLKTKTKPQTKNKHTKTSLRLLRNQCACFSAIVFSISGHVHGAFAAANISAPKDLLQLLSVLLFIDCVQ